MPTGLSFAAIAPSLFGAVASAALGSIMSGDKGSSQQAAPAPPPVEPVTPMPTANDASVKAAQQKSIVAQIQRQGRANSILTAGNASNDAMG